LRQDKALTVSNQRKSIRIEVPMPVTLRQGDDIMLNLITCDICDGGVFVKAEPDQLLPVGSKVSLQVTAGLLAGDESPLVDAEVVRTTDDGMGLKFL
jgi:hypothetical protein